MNRELIRPLTRRVNRAPRLFNERNGSFYDSYIQNRFPQEEAVAYLFCSTCPEVGDTITDRLDGEKYRVKAVVRRPWKFGSRKARYEVTLIPLLL